MPVVRAKNSEGKNPLENFSPWFFAIKTTSSSLITFQRAQIPTRSTTHLCWCNWRIFWRKNASERSPMWSCSCTTMPRLSGHLQPKRNWPTWASIVLITHPILWILSRRTTTFSLDWKKQSKVRHFSPTRRSLLSLRPGWTYHILNFFLRSLQKLQQRATKCFELGGEYVEWISSLVTVACFLPGWAKDLSTPRCVFVCLYIYIYMFVCMYVFMCGCVWVCVCVRARAFLMKKSLQPPVSLSGLPSLHSQSELSLFLCLSRSYKNTD